MSELGPFTIDEFNSMPTPAFSGITLAAIEVVMIIGAAACFRNYNKIVMKATHNLNAFTYYWFVFTMFTGFMWESAFVAQYRDVNEYSEHLIKNNQTVWFNKYSLDYLLPWKFSKIFYGDYGAYADREYMVSTNDWSRVIESTHAIMCALFALLAFVMGYFKLENRMSICIGASMGTQLMNSILYMAAYVVQMGDPDNVNYPTKTFPAGTLLVHRPFMWVNVFWTVIPLYILVIELIFKNGIKINYTPQDYTRINKQMENVKLLTENQKLNYGTSTSTSSDNVQNGVETRAAKRARLEKEQHNKGQHELIDMATNY